MGNTLCPKARSENLVVQTLPGETLIYDMTANEAHCLNETAAFVWSKCNGDLTVDDIAHSAATAFGKPVNADLINFAVKELNDRKLLSDSGVHLPAMPSRREVIKRLGLASAIALPIIASIVAPSSALASISCSCSSPGNCISQAGNACPPGALFCNIQGICVVTP